MHTKTKAGLAKETALWNAYPFLLIYLILTLLVIHFAYTLLITGLNIVSMLLHKHCFSLRERLVRWIHLLV